MNILERMERGVVLADGAMGTLLIERGAEPFSCLEALCLESPEVVAQVHADYAAAGAEIARTNSFRANARHLARFGLEHRVNEINWQAAQIARQAVKGSDVIVAGSVGPVGAPELSEAGRAELFRTQIGALLDGGAQMICFETFQNPEELLLALEVKYSLHHCPAVCSLAVDVEGRLPDGRSVAEAFEVLERADAEVVGLNCLNGVAEAIRLLAAGPIGALPLSVLPNAGLPDVSGGRAIYPVGPEAFAEGLRVLAGMGPRMVGGCCGTTPAHIAAARAVLRDNCL